MQVLINRGREGREEARGRRGGAARERETRAGRRREEGEGRGEAEEGTGKEGGRRKGEGRKRKREEKERIGHMEKIVSIALVAVACPLAASYNACWSARLAVVAVSGWECFAALTVM